MNWPGYGWRVLIALDQLLNTLAGGDPDETISSRAEKARRDGKRWGCFLCRWLDWLDPPDHCARAVEEDEARAAAKLETAAAARAGRPMVTSHES